MVICFFLIFILVIFLHLLSSIRSSAVHLIISIYLLVV